MTQALALQRILRDAGHSLAHVVLGQSRHRTVPDFFLEKIGAPVTRIQSPSFVGDAADRSVRPVRTVLREALRLPAFARSVRTIHTLVQRHTPDVIVNFFEPTGGLYATWYRPDVPVVSIAHQYMFHHPAYAFPPKDRLGAWSARTFAHATAWGATRRLALSLYPAPDRPSDRLDVLPPLLRADVLRQPTDRAAPFFLVYILNSGYAREIVAWHERNPDVPLHCFWDRPDAAPVERHDDTLTFHQLDDEKFVHLMARCAGLVCTAGFESVAEAMYLGKPVQVVPVDGHFEQRCNAHDTVQAGAGIQSTRFEMDRLREFLPRYRHNAERFRRWVEAGRARFVHAIESAAQDDSLPADGALPPVEVALST